MPKKVKPTAKGWELAENTRKSVIYSCPELNFRISLVKNKGVWDIKYFEQGELIGIDDAPLKHVAVAIAKAFMYHNAVIHKMVPVLKPGENLTFKARDFKNPGRVTQLSRFKR